MVLLGKDENMGSQRREKLCCLVLMAKLQFVLKIKYESILKVGKKKKKQKAFCQESQEKNIFINMYSMFMF